MTKKKPESLPSISRAALQILLALADQDRHGYAIIQDVAERTGGRTRLSPGTLYSTLKKMLEEGLIEEKRARPRRADDDPRRRYYRLTPLGRSTAGAEVARLDTLVRQARSFGLLRKRDA